MSLQSMDLFGAPFDPVIFSSVFFFSILTQGYVFISFYRERKGGGEKYQCEKHRLVAFLTCPNQGSNLQPRYVP